MNWFFGTSRRSKRKRRQPLGWSGSRCRRLVVESVENRLMLSVSTLGDGVAADQAGDPPLLEVVASAIDAQLYEQARAGGREIAMLSGPNGTVWQWLVAVDLVNFDIQETVQVAPLEGSDQVSVHVLNSIFPYVAQTDSENAFVATSIQTEVTIDPPVSTPVVEPDPPIVDPDPPAPAVDPHEEPETSTAPEPIVTSPIVGPRSGLPTSGPVNSDPPEIRYYDPPKPVVTVNPPDPTPTVTEQPTSPPVAETHPETAEEPGQPVTSPPQTDLPPSESTVPPGFLEPVAAEQVVPSRMDTGEIQLLVEPSGELRVEFLDPNASLDLYTPLVSVPDQVGSPIGREAYSTPLADVPIETSFSFQHVVTDSLNGTSRFEVLTDLVIPGPSPNVTATPDSDSDSSHRSLIESVTQHIGALVTGALYSAADSLGLDVSRNDDDAPPQAETPEPNPSVDLVLAPRSDADGLPGETLTLERLDDADSRPLDDTAGGEISVAAVLKPGWLDGDAAAAASIADLVRAERSTSGVNREPGISGELARAVAFAIVQSDDVSEPTIENAETPITAAATDEAISTTDDTADARTAQRDESLQPESTSVGLIDVRAVLRLDEPAPRGDGVALLEQPSARRSALQSAFAQIEESVGQAVRVTVDDGHRNVLGTLPMLAVLALERFVVPPRSPQAEQESRRRLPAR